MPLRFVHDPTLDLVLTTAEGPVTAADLMEHAAAIAAELDRPAMELVDLTGQGEISVELATVRKMAEYLRDEDDDPTPGKLAMVADDEALFGVLRLYSVHRQTGSLEILVFRTREEALAWLGITEADLPGGAA